MKAAIQLFAILTVVSLSAACAERPTARVGKTVTTGQADIGGAFALVNHNGESVTDKTYHDKPQLIYFGFSYCPDVCPIALQKMGATQAQLGARGQDLNYLFISIDPERDTPESLGPYVEANGFPENLVGLTGTQDQIDVAKTAFKVYSQKVAIPDSLADYTVDHSDIIYLMNKDGSFAEFFSGRSTVPEMVAAIRYLLGTAG